LVPVYKDCGKRVAPRVQDKEIGKYAIVRPLSEEEVGAREAETGEISAAEGARNPFSWSA